MRLFIAINFSGETVNRLASLRDELRSRSRRGNFSLPENLHLTLVFLGECDKKQSTAAKAAMDELSLSPMEILIERVGRFRRDGGDIWWAGVRENRALLNLQHELTEKLLAAGFDLDRRRYSPHITLGRSVETDASPWNVTPFGETVPNIELMNSERVKGILTYTAIYKTAK